MTYKRIQAEVDDYVCAYVFALPTTLLHESFLLNGIKAPNPKQSNIFAVCGVLTKVIANDFIQIQVINSQGYLRHLLIPMSAVGMVYA